MEIKTKRYFEKEISNKLGDKFTEEFEKLCESYGFSDNYALLRFYDILHEQYDTEDAKTWLLKEGLDSLAEDEEFLKNFVATYNNRYESEYGIWDNMSAALDWMTNTAKWVDAITAAKKQSEEE